VIQGVIKGYNILYNRIMKVKHKILLLALMAIFSATTTVYSQNKNTATDTLEIIQDYKIKELLDKSIELNSKTTVRGYRVKIHFGAEKSQAYEIKEKFNAKFVDIPSYVRYDQPYFSVRVGNFRTKLEAYKFLKQIQGDYAQAFLVQDEIELK
jgi:hypothetical protein